MMRKILFASTLLLTPYITTVLATAQPAAEAGARRVAANAREQRITLGLNKAEIIELDRDVKDVDVASPDIVDAVVKSPRRILLIAAKAGQTNVFFTDAEGRRLLTLDIRVERDVTDLGLLMQATLPKSAIKVSTFNDNVVLAGNVANALEAKRATDLAAAFAGDPKKVVNMLSVAGGEQVMLKVRIAEMSRNIAKQFSINAAGAVNVGGVPIISATNNPYSLLGRALSDASGAQIGSVCPQAFIPNRTATTTSQMVTGNTTVNTLTNGTNNLSTTYDTAISSSNPQLQQPGIVTGQQNTNTASVVGAAVQTVTSALAPTVTQTITDTSSCASANNAQGVLNALERVGLVHMLAEPNLVSVNGETAKMRAGGEFPVPTARDRDGNITLEFKPFGVGLSFTPVVISPERISIQLSSEVSELSNTGAFVMASTTTNVNGVQATTPGVTIPALGVRRTETVVELPSGGSFAIAGLLQRNIKQIITGFPGAKDLPVLGALFRSRDFQNDETELVVLVSVYLVQPNAESAFSSPTDGFVAPSDPETLLMGRLNAVYRKETKPLEMRADAPVGFIVQ
ncbi:MAG TPA: type II and III secretion system protein family protein [Rhizomicrobium sp.]|nr:type II and III secretion system protein family protein [Rhizomicrobium sp.]